MRTLKFHEKKLMKKVDLFHWKKENSREVEVMRRYHIQNREDYAKYNKIVGMITKLTALLRDLEPNDPVRMQVTKEMIDKLFDMGVITNKKSLKLCEKLTVSAFCRRRLAVVLTRLKMAETMKEAVQFVEHGHIRVGPHPVTEPAFHVTRNMEDFVTWVDSSKIREKVLRYNDKLDDFDLFGV